MTYELTAHTRESLRKRANIRLEWLERVMEQPQFVYPDPMDPELEHRVGKIDEFEGRVLRVIVIPNTDPIRVITAFFDLSMRDKL
ncbi:MAG: DUF4258 domain-containing protein [Methylococcaceae bacterium]|nr:DUF4258 domain-containing protein [Methylococcaceae bacterium]